MTLSPPSSGSMRLRLSVLLASLLLLMLGVGIAGLLLLHDMSSSLQSLFADRLMPMQQLRQMQTKIGVQAPASLRLIEDGVDTQRGNLELASLADSALLDWTDYKATRMVAREDELIARVDPLLSQMLVAMRNNRASSGAVLHARGLLITLNSTAVSRLLDELMAVQLQVGAQQTAEAQRAVRLAIGLLSVLLLLGCALGFWLSRNVQLHHDEQTQAMRGHRERLQRFYVALSQTNQLIIQGSLSEEDLLQALCRICVDTGQARLAAVVTRQGELFQRVAVAGPADQLMPGSPQRWSLDTPFAQTSLSTKVLTGQGPIVINRLADHPELLQPPAPLVPPGVEAMAAFALHQDGQPIAALSLLAAEADFFDQALVQLLQEMVDDMSFALGHIRKRLQDSERLQLAEVFVQGPLPSLLLDERAQVVQANQAMSDLCGLPRQTLRQQRLADLGLGLSTAALARIQEAVRQRQSLPTVALQLRRRDGQFHRQHLSLCWLEGPQPCMLMTLWSGDTAADRDNPSP